MTHVAIVILNYNGQTLLPVFLPSVVSHSSGAEIIIADNGSTDQSVAWVRNTFPTIRIISLGHNYGYCGGYNRALKQVQSEIYILLNSDVEVTAGWLAPILDTFAYRDDVAAVQPRILSYRAREKFEYAGAAGGYIDQLAYPFCRGRILNHVETDYDQYNDITEIFWASGACLGIRAHLFHQFGGFDERFFAHMEEIDLCWKLQRAAWRVLYQGESKVYHLGAATLAYNTPRKNYLNFRNGLSLLIKHLPPNKFAIKFVARLFMDQLAVLFFFLKGEFRLGISIWRAHLDVIVHFRSHWRERIKLKDRLPFTGLQTIYPGSIVFEYYIRKKRTFKDLKFSNSPR